MISNPGGPAYSTLRTQVLPTQAQLLREPNPSRITTAIAMRVSSTARQEVRCFVCLAVVLLRLSSFSGCCETTCLAADAEETTYVCEIVQGGVDPEETTSTEDVVSETTAPPPKGNNNPAPTRTPSRSTTSSRSTGSVPTTAPRDGASSLTGKSAAFVAGLVGAMMVLA